MKNNFLNDLQFDQEVHVFYDYHVFEDIDILDSYPFDSYASLPSPDVRFWKRNLKEEFILEKNFHRDFLYRSSKTSIERWATYKNIPFNELLTILEKNQKLEELSNQTDEDYCQMKVESPFNDSLILGVTPDAAAKIPKTYKLQDAHSLYTEIAKLDVFDIDSLLKFSKHFGMPSGIMDDAGFGIVLDGDCLLFPFGSISLLNKKIAIYKNDFKLFELIQTNNVSKILSYLPKTEFEYIDDDDAVINLAKQHLSLALGKLDAFNVSMYLEFQDGSFFPGVWFTDLFNFAYFQLAKALSNNVEVLECDNCGHIFEVTHKRQRFCPPLPNRKRSSCEMAYNNRLKKEKKLKGEI
jgi:hypothetical protein